MIAFPVHVARLWLLLACCHQAWGWLTLDGLARGSGAEEWLLAGAGLVVLWICAAGLMTAHVTHARTGRWEAAWLRAGGVLSFFGSLALLIILGVGV